MTVTIISCIKRHGKKSKSRFFWLVEERLRLKLNLSLAVNQFDGRHRRSVALREPLGDNEPYYLGSGGVKRLYIEQFRLKPALVGLACHSHCR